MRLNTSSFSTNPSLRSLLLKSCAAVMLGFLILASFQCPAVGQTEPVIEGTNIQPLTFGGNVSLSSEAYGVNGIDSRRPPASALIRSYQRVLSINGKNEQAYANLIDLHQNQNSLDKLCDVWMSRYRANRRNDVLKEHLIEALHKAGRYEDAQQIVAQN
ncbi:MAG: hypothetical protein GF372_14505 [Candidatus Marinimicrobia bacterium]|nr:hypothetical protein [Candidatus Neomarinimicrobiota bacterium]